MSDAPALPIGVVGVSGGGLTAGGLETLSGGRAMVAAVYDAVRVRAEKLGRETDRPMRMFRSVTKMAEHSGLRGAVILDSGWGGLWSARALCEGGLPVLWLADWPGEPAWDFRGAGRDLLVPGLRLRYEPSTLRLRERIATDLGAVDSVQVTTPGPLWEAADWAAWVAGSPVRGRDEEEIVTRSGVGLRVDAGEALSAAIVCDHGEAEWTPGSLVVNGEAVTLDEERSSVGLLLSLFLRRAAGGLVPVPSVDEVLAAGGATA